MNHVFCLEGVHAAGKSSLVTFMKSLNYHTSIENFEKIGQFEPTDFLTECYWICGWFKRVANELDTATPANPIIVDRSPYSALMYCKPEAKESLHKIIEAGFAELYAKYTLSVHVMMVCVPDDVLFERIRSRLESEPARRTYGEDNIQHTIKIIQNYKHHFCEVCPINTVVHNIDLYECVDYIILYIRKVINSVMNSKWSGCETSHVQT